MLDFDGYVLRYMSQRSVMAKPTERKANTRKIIPLIPESVTESNNPNPRGDEETEAQQQRNE